MAGRQTLGEAFSKPYESVTRAGGNLSRSRMNDQRSLQMPEEQRRRDYMTQIRSQLIQHQMKMAEGHLGVMQQNSNDRAQGMAEKKREFDLNLDLQNRSLAQQGAMGGKWDPQWIKDKRQAMTAADAVGAVKEDGSIDFDILKQHPDEYDTYLKGMDASSKHSHTAQQINKANYSKIIDTTLQLLDPDKLEESFKHYSGVKGEGEYAKDVAKSMFGGEMPEYFRAYQAFNGIVPVAVKQGSQFWGASVQPGVQEKLTSLFKQDNPFLNWQQRLENVRNIGKLLKSEGAVYQGAVNSPLDEQAYKENETNRGLVGNATLTYPQGLKGGKSGRSYSDQEIAQLAQKNGISVEALKDILTRTG